MCLHSTCEAIIPQLATDDFIAISNSSCVCEGYTLVYECRVTGGNTVWNGTAFQCSSSGNEIILLQSRTAERHTCNNGAISGRIIRADENNTKSYVSWLTIVVGAEMIGKNISCLRDIGGTHDQRLIGSSVLTLTTGNTMSCQSIS